MVLATSKIIDLILIYPINAVIIFNKVFIFIMPTNPTQLVLTIWTLFTPNFRLELTHRQKPFALTVNASIFPPQAIAARTFLRINED
jgi:hypothetical protein